MSNSHMIYPVAHLHTLESTAVSVTVARITTRYHCAEHKHSGDAGLTNRVRYRRGGTLRYFPRPALSMPTYPCPTAGCGGWTHRRAGKWHHLPVDFALQLDEACLALHRRICQRCWNRHSNHTLSLDGRIRSRSRSQPSTAPLIEQLLAAADVAQHLCPPAAAHHPHTPAMSHSYPPSSSATNDGSPAPARTTVAAVPVTPAAFFSSHRSRSSETDRLLLLGDCSSYLDAVLATVRDVVQLDLAEDSLHSARLLNSATCTLEQWAAVLRADHRVPVFEYDSCVVDGVSARQAVFERCAMGQPAVYLDHPTFPSRLSKMGLSGWDAEVSRKRWKRVVNEQPEVDASKGQEAHPSMAQKVRADVGCRCQSAT